ncbi:MAG: hypothetical protein K2Y27_32230 [Xanthobacteraceae bacterium]|nr:hypothetical protein [Xanthobacteraceae bacterium]
MDTHQHSHPAFVSGRRLGLIVALSIVLLVVFAAGMAIGYHSVYRHNTVASLMPEAGPQR